MNNKRYKQTIIPKADLPEEWKGITLHQLKTLIFNHIKSKYSGMVIQNLDTRLPIIISVTSARKTAYGEAVYFKKAAAILILPEIIRFAHSIGCTISKRREVLLQYRGKHEKAHTYKEQSLTLSSVWAVLLFPSPTYRVQIYN